jgi:hypothetical protein
MGSPRRPETLPASSAGDQAALGRPRLRISIIPAAERDPAVIALRDNHIMHVVRVLDLWRDVARVADRIDDGVPG